MILGNRRSIRLKKYDYSSTGYYFVTVCTQNREFLFGEIIVGATRGSPKYLKLNKIGNVANIIWK